MFMVHFWTIEAMEDPISWKNAYRSLDVNGVQFRFWFQNHNFQTQTEMMLIKKNIQYHQVLG